MSAQAIADRATPEVVVGMVGAGQLARMTQRAAIDLGIRLRVLSEHADDPAVRAGAEHVRGSAERLEDLRALATGCDVVTFDHERIPPRHLAVLDRAGVRLVPRAPAKLLAQDKLAARRCLAAKGFPVPPHACVRDAGEATRFAARHGWPVVLKAPRGGYDGRGVWTVADARQAAEVLTSLSGGALVEAYVPIKRELAVLIARTPKGASVSYPVVETLQRDAMCREVIAPAEIDQALATEATALAGAIADAIGAAGVLAVELFETADGLIVNELALRPHNSGHYTIEGCATSQFEQHLRAILEWPLGQTTLRARAVATVNVIGKPGRSDPRERVAAALGIPGAHVHLYGKTPRPGRKLGHVTVCGDDAATVRHTAQRAAALLEGQSQ